MTALGSFSLYSFSSPKCIFFPGGTASIFHSIPYCITVQIQREREGKKDRERSKQTTNVKNPNESSYASFNSFQIDEIEGNVFLENK